MRHLRSLFLCCVCAAVVSSCSSSRKADKRQHTFDSTSVVLRDTSQTFVIVDTTREEENKVTVTEITFAPGSDVTITAEGGISGNVSSYKKTSTETKKVENGKTETTAMQMHYNSNASVKEKEVTVRKESRGVPAYRKYLAISLLVLVLVAVVWLKRIPIFERLKKILGK